MYIPPDSLPARLTPRERALIDASARTSAQYTLADLADHPEAVHRLALQMGRLLTMDDLKVLFGFKTDEPIARLIKDGTLQAVKIGKEWRCSWENYRRACDRLFAHSARPARIRNRKQIKL